MAEQMGFDFDGNKEIPPPPAQREKIEYNFAERDECTRCGAPFESMNSCVECAHNPMKAKYKAEHKQGK